MAASDEGLNVPPIQVEVWARIGLQPTMHLIGTLEYPTPAPVNEEDLLVEFAKQILVSRESPES